MSLQNELKAFFYFLPRLFKDLWEHERNLLRHYVAIIVIVLLMVLGGAGAFFGYRWYTVSREQGAQLLLANHLEQFERILGESPEVRPVALAQLDSSLAFDYMQYKKNGVAPLFLLLQSDVQIKQDRFADAAGTLQEVINSLSASSPLLPLVKTKRALLQLDSDDAAVQEIGLHELTQLAHDTQNGQRDVALYYLGRYYWVHDKVDDARTAWQELVNDPVYTQQSQSPWAYDTQEALAQLGD